MTKTFDFSSLAGKPRARPVPEQPQTNGNAQGSFPTGGDYHTDAAVKGPSTPVAEPIDVPLVIVDESPAPRPETMPAPAPKAKP